MTSMGNVNIEEYNTNMDLLHQTQMQQKHTLTKLQKMISSFSIWFNSSIYDYCDLVTVYKLNFELSFTVLKYPKTFNVN